MYFLKKILHRMGGGLAILQVLVRIFEKMLKVLQMDIVPEVPLFCLKH